MTEECNICYTPIAGPDTATPPQLCGHNTYHHDCMARWLADQRARGCPESCPECRSAVPNDYATIITHPHRSTHALMTSTTISYYNDSTHLLTEPLPRRIDDLAADLVVKLGSEPLVLRRHSHIRQASSITCVAHTHAELLNALRWVPNPRLCKQLAPHCCFSAPPDSDHRDTHLTTRPARSTGTT